MRTIHKIEEWDLQAFVRIAAMAYPGVSLVTAVDRQRYLDRTALLINSGKVHLFGLFEEKKLLGSMRLYDFRMNFHGSQLRVGGVGGIAVDLPHKKRQVAADLLRFYLRYYKDQGASLAMLYPFRPDFYRRMGFGYGTKMSQYRVKPHDLPKGESKTAVDFCDETDREALAACYDRFQARRHGLVDRHDYTWDMTFRNRSMQVVGVKEDGSNGRLEASRSRHISGYLTFQFKPVEGGTFLSNDIHIQEMVYETPQALSQLMTFLHSQADQINRVVFNTQDSDFHHLLTSPLNGSDNLIPSIYHESNAQGVGIMYRVIDVPKLFTAAKAHNFGGQNCRLKIILEDSFFPQNTGSTRVDFVNGTPHLVSDSSHEVEIRLDVSDFSALVMGTVRFEWLVGNGRCALSDPAYLNTIHNLFTTHNKPLCMTHF